MAARVLCVCGSFRFQAEMNALQEDLRRQGIECLMPIPDSDVARGIRGCFRRIDVALVVVVVNPGDYIGTSVLLDMGYAYAKQKPIYALAEPHDPAVRSLVATILKPAKSN